MKRYTLKNLVYNDPNNSKAPMTQAKIQHIVRELEHVELLTDEPGYVLFKYLGTKMALYPDPHFNRMRVIAPITDYSSLAPQIKDALMNANFSSALDCRYGVSEDALYAAFLHPLTSLTEKDFLSTLKQLHNLVKSFGKTYSSAQIAFTKKK